MIEIVVVIAHAIHVQLLLFFPTSRWRSWGINPGGGPGEVLEVCQQDREDHQRK